MRIIFLVLTLFYLFFGVSPIFAFDPPNLLSPSNNSTVTSSKLEWQTPAYTIYSQGSPYIVQIKNTSAFTSSDDRYKTNTYYTPQLSDGTWYWRVKAKNSDGIWSDWSTIWSFTLTAATPTPTPTPTSAPTPTPKPTATPTSKPTVKPSPITIPTHTPIATPTIPPTINASTPQPSTGRVIIPNQSEGLSFAWARKVASSGDRIASVAGEETSATPEAEIIVKTKKQTNYFILVGWIFVIIGISSLGFIIYKTSFSQRRKHINS